MNGAEHEQRETTKETEQCIGNIDLKDWVRGGSEWRMRSA